MSRGDDVLGARILVVDDVEADARLVAAMLEGAGFAAVTTVSDAAQALAMHRERCFDLVIVDVMMPGMDGFELLREISAVDPDCPVPVIMVTAEPDYMKRALEDGARDFIAKPIRMMELVPRVRNALRIGMRMREVEGRYRALVEQSIAGIYVVENGRFTYVNPRMCELLGYTQDELCGRETLDLVHEEDRSSVLAMRERQAAGHPGSMAATWRLRRKEGLVVHLSFDARMLERAGRRVIFGIALDQTEQEHNRALLREAEGHYRALVEQSITGIFLGEGGRVVYANPRLCEILGYTLQELAGLTLEDVVMAEDLHVVRHLQRGRQAGDRSAFSFQCDICRKDGRIMHLSVETKPIELLGRPATLGVVQDVTERKRAQDALETANHGLRTLSDRVLAVQEDERGRIARELHDDVGQSLVALDIGLHRLGAHVQSAHQPLLRECIAVAGGVRDKLREIALELHPPHLDQLGLQDALRWLVERHRGITGMSIDVRFDAVDALKVAPSVETACYRICQEALTNAMRHARARRVIVELAARSGRLVVTVSDDGRGFDRAAHGAGIMRSGSMGLVGMEERARLAGGRFDVASMPGAGTSVSASFPIGEPAESTAAAERV